MPDLDTTTPEGYEDSYPYWLGYLLFTVKDAARRGDTSALRSLQVFCTESTLALNIDQDALNDIMAKAEA